MEARSIYSRTSRSSMCASSTSTEPGVRIKMEKVPSGDTIIRFSVKGYSSERTGAQRSRNGYEKRDSKHNVNNFLVVHMKGHDYSIDE